MIHLESDNNRDVRGVLIIDPDNIIRIRAEFFYPRQNYSGLCFHVDRRREFRTGKFYGI